METNTQEVNTEVVEQTSGVTTETKPQPTLEEQLTHAKQMTEFQFQAYTEIVKAHLSALTRVMRSSNGVNQLQKIQAEKALFEAIDYALDFGVGLKNPYLRDKGVVFAKEANNLSASLAQAMDQRMLLIAFAKKEADEAAQQTETVTETQTEENTNV